MTGSFKLSAVLAGHEDDVRTLISPNDSLIISGSRDSTVRSWTKLTESKWDPEPTINYKSTKFINSLAFYNDNKLNEQFIVSGGNDSLITLTSLASTLDVNEPEFVLVGHTSNVCSLDSLGDLILSGSWDSTAKVWNKQGEVLHTLKGHENSVWAVKFIDKDEYLTASADKTVRKWKDGKELAKITSAHEDAIRDLVLLGDGTFATCSNDKLIKIWDLETFKEISILTGHDSFVYSLDVLPNGDLVSAGEDRTVRVWRGDECIQVISLPCISIWKVCALSNGDIVVGSSDNKIRVFTTDSSRIASKDEILEFEKELQISSINENAIDGFSKERLAGPEILKTKGKIEGQTVTIKTAVGTIEMYQWSFSGDKWVKIGEIVSSTSSSSSEKKFYKGSWYDYVFDVDIEDGKPALKLPFNVTENPYDVADKFLVDNNLPYSYLQEVVNFIMTNSSGVTLDSSEQQQTASEPYKDPAYSGGPTRAFYSSSSTILPQTQYLGFTSFNEPALIVGFKKLNAKQQPQNKLDERQFESLINCQDYQTLGSNYASFIILNWEEDTKLIGFDLLRCIISKIKPFDNLFDLIKIGLNNSNPKIRMMSIRVLVNIFQCKAWGQEIFKEEEIIDIVFNGQILTVIPELPKFMPISIATLLLNYSVLINKYKLLNLLGALKPKLDNICELILLTKDEESVYRLLIAYGTLNHYRKLDGEEFLKQVRENFKSDRFTKVFNELN